MLVAPTKQSIDPNSTIDTSHISHFVKMPNLSYFQLHGFPYSRMADLSETAFVLTEKNRSSELLGTYLTVLGRIGNITRFPGLSVSVIEEQSSQSLKGKDLIFIQNDLVDSDLVQSWNLDTSMKIGFFQKIKNSIQNFSFSELFAKSKESPEDKNVSIEKTVGQIIQVNSPISPDRTVVLISSISPAGFKSINHTLMGTDDLSGKFFGGKVLITETEKISLESQDSYYLGQLTLPEFFQWSLQQHPILFVLASLLSILFVTAFVHGRLKKKVKSRYAGHSN
jgi:membrane protein implicated in regulation of membrane protease activity